MEESFPAHLLVDLPKAAAHMVHGLPLRLEGRDGTCVLLVCGSPMSDLCLLLPALGSCCLFDMWQPMQDTSRKPVAGGEGVVRPSVI